MVMMGSSVGNCLPRRQSQVEWQSATGPENMSTPHPNLIKEAICKFTHLDISSKVGLDKVARSWLQWV